MMGISELAKTRFVVPPPGAGTRVILEQALQKAGLSLVISVETAHRAMIVPLVLAGAGAAVLPRSMAEDAASKGAVVVATDPRLHHRGRLVWRPGQLSPAAEKFTAVTSAYTETRGAPMDAL
jgi:DNA-binding transcriptional LysR family regulator